MKTLRRILGKKAAKATVRHTAHGVASKVQRKPFRSTSLLSAGAAVGLAAGWLAGKKTGSHDTAA